MPPSPPPGWLPRRLLPLETALPALTVLEAGPGYGKTLGLYALIEPLRERQAPVAWLTLDAYDADVSSFFHYLAAGLAEHVPQLGAEIETLLLGDKLDPRLLWQGLFGAIAAYNVPLCALVLDDAHHLAEQQPETFKALAYFLDKLPEGVHVLLSSRKRLPLSLGKLTAENRALILDQARLRFTPEEQAAFLRARAQQETVPEAWARRSAQLDGWPLGLSLLASGAEVELERAGRGDALSEYVAEELYAAQSEAQRDFMLKAALLQELTADACRLIFQALDAAERLAELEAHQLIMRLADGQAFRFPTYLQEFLRAEGERTISPIAFASWHRRAANFYQSEGREELAIPHLIASGDWTGALVACQASFPAMRFSGRQHQIERWLAAFPDEIAQSEPLVPLWRGHMLSRSGQMTEALEAYDRALGLYKARESSAGVFKVLVRLFSLALLRRDAENAALLMRETLALVAIGEPDDVVDLHLARALAADQRGDMALVRECNELALSIPIAGSIETAASHYIARTNLYTLALHKGHLHEALRHVERALEIAENWQFYPYHLVASFLRAHLQLLEGDVETPGRFLRALPPYWTELLDWHDLACALAVLGMYHQAKGAWKDAEDALRRSLALFTEADYDIGKKVPIERLVWIALQRRQFSRIEELLGEAKALDLHNVYDLAILVPRARVRHLDGHAAEALAEIERVLPALRELDALLLLARARLFEAACRRKLGQEAEAREALAEAMRLIETEGFDFLLVQDQTLWEELRPLGSAERVVSAAEPLPAETPLVGTGPLRMQPVAVPVGDTQLAIRCFGTFEVKLGGVVLDQWPRRKSKLILAALILSPRGLRLADLAEQLGAEDFTSAVQRTFQSDLSALRRSLEPELAKGETSRYLKLVDDRYTLAWDQVGLLDVRQFDLAIARGRELRETDPEVAAGAFAEAIGYYRGTFLEDGLFQGLFEGPRESFRREAVEAMLWLDGFYQSHQQPDQAEEVLKRAIAIEPCEEELYIALMRLYQTLGRPVMVRKIYYDCRKALKSQLGVEPSDVFEKAYKVMA